MKVLASVDINISANAPSTVRWTPKRCVTAAARAHEAAEEDADHGRRRDHADFPPKAYLQRQHQHARRRAQAGRDEQRKEDHDDERVVVAERASRRGGVLNRATALNRRWMSTGSALARS